MTANHMRFAGGAVVVAAVAIAVTASRYEVGFYTDPLGASGLPYLAAVLLGVGGAWLAARPDASSVTGVPVKRASLVVVGLLGYAAVLPTLGFVVSTSAVVVVLGSAFGAPLRRSVVLGAAYTVVLYLLFSSVLGLPLPVGSLFLRAG